MKRLNKAGFTLIELLAVITIIGILLGIAIPSVGYLIERQRREVYAQIAHAYVRSAQNVTLTENAYEIIDSDTTYYVHINNIEMETEQKGSPFAPFEDA